MLWLQATYDVVFLAGVEVDTSSEWDSWKALPPCQASPMDFSCRLRLDWGPGEASSLSTRAVAGLAGTPAVEENGAYLGDGWWRIFGEECSEAVGLVAAAATRRGDWRLMMWGSTGWSAGTRGEEDIAECWRRRFKSCAQRWKVSSCTQVGTCMSRDTEEILAKAGLPGNWELASADPWWA